MKGNAGRSRPAPAQCERDPFGLGLHAKSSPGIVEVAKRRARNNGGNMAPNGGATNVSIHPLIEIVRFLMMQATNVSHSLIEIESIFDDASHQCESLLNLQRFDDGRHKCESIFNKMERA